MKKHTIWRVTKYALALGLGAIVISEVNLEAIADLSKSISLSWFFLSVCAFYASIWFMAIRYWVLIDARTGFNNVLAAVLYQTLMSNLITPVVGVAWYVGALRNDYDIPPKQSLLSLVVARFCDVVVWLLSLSVATVVVWHQITMLHGILLLLISVLTGVVLVCVMTVTFRRTALTFAGRIQIKIRCPGNFVTRFLTEVLSREIGEYLPLTRSFVAYSLLSSGSMLFFAYAGLRVFGVSIDIWPVIFVVALTQIMSLIPVQVLGGLGLYDFTYLYLYGLFGMDRTEFAGVIVGLRICFYLANLGLLPVLLIVTKFYKRELAESNRKPL